MEKDLANNNKRSQDSAQVLPNGELKHSITFGHQAALKRLPLPPLQATLDKFLHETVKPLLTPAEFEATARAVRDFEEEGKTLYSLLERKAETDNSYIESYWDQAYLAYDTPLPININPVFVLEDDPTPSRAKLLSRAVSLVFSSLKFVRAVKTGTLQPDRVKDAPLCMDQFKRLFGSARVPAEAAGEGDKVVTDQESTHICVICEGQFYYFRCLYPGTFDLAVTERELTKIFSQIIHDATANPEQNQNHRVGLLTTELRGKWREQRAQLCRISDNNAKVLNKIDRALFVVCLDVKYEASSVSEACANILHGDPNQGTSANRWYDKLQLIITNGGTAGVNFEHSAVDGHSVLRYASDVFIDTIVRFAQTIQLGGIHSPLDNVPSSTSQQRAMVRPDCKPRKLEFDLDKQMRKHIHFAESRLADAIFQNHTTTMEFTGYGKTFLVQNNLSPDATVQVAMQTAFYQLYGEAANTYESVLTKAFFHGRTEAGRSCTAQAVEFMRKYCEQDGEDEEVEEEDAAAAALRIKLLRTATKQHSKMTGEASKAMGVDRLLYAMECMAHEKGLAKPALFTSPGYSKLNTSVLSTSNCGNPSLRFFGFGPVCPQGFGIGYIIKEESIHLMITSKRRQTDRYRDTLQQILERIHDDLICMRPEPPLQDALMNFRNSSSVTCLADLVQQQEQGGETVGNGSMAFMNMQQEEDAAYDFFGLGMRDMIGRKL